MWQTIVEFLKKGGPFMIMNVVCLAVVVALIIERSIYFLTRGQINQRAFLEQIRRLVVANNVDRAKKLCDATSAPIARVAKAGLNRAHRGEAAVAQAVEEAIVDVTPEIKTRIGALWSLANIATLLGLLGTVSALITIFHDVAFAAPQDKQFKLSSGISEAMYNTATGLFIAVLCMVAHLIMSAAAKRVMSDLESFSLRFENMLGGEPGAGASASGQAPAADR